MKSIRIVQIYQDVNMGICRGHQSLTAYLNKKGRKNFEDGDVFCFFNRERNIFKAFAPTRLTVTQESLPGKETWDMSLRKDQLFATIGRAFGLHWNVKNAIFEQEKGGEKDG